MTYTEILLTNMETGTDILVLSSTKVSQGADFPLDTFEIYIIKLYRALISEI